MAMCLTVLLAEVTAGEDSEQPQGHVVGVGRRKPGSTGLKWQRFVVRIVCDSV
jgi:hypothetical protein